METLYWITVLGKFNVLIWIIFTVSLVMSVIIGASWLQDGLEGDGLFNKAHKKSMIISTSIMLSSLLIAVFVPSKNELYMIYGVGSVIDYVKSNNKAKELPDKAVDAIYKYLEAINKENNE
jgi:hypothetical protein